MENVHSRRLLKFHAMSDADGMNNSKGCAGVYVNLGNKLPTLWRFSVCPTPSGHKERMNTTEPGRYYS
jgi:hypothetical protein